MKPEISSGKRISFYKRNHFLTVIVFLILGTAFSYRWKDPKDVTVPPPVAPEGVLRIAFIVTNPHLGSSIMRGRIIGQHLNTLGTNIQVVDAKQETPDVCICVKNCDAKLTKVCREKGAKVVWDMLDKEIKNVNPKTRAEYAKKCGADGYFVPNRHMQYELRHIDPARSSAVVPHHHTNFLNLTVSVRDPPEVFAYTSGINNVMKGEVHDLFVRVASNHAMVYKDLTVEDTPKVNATIRKVDEWDQARYHLRPVEEGVDLAIIWPHKFDDFTLKERPVTRLAYWWTHGVPVLYFPMQSYVEAVKVADYEYPGRLDNLEDLPHKFDKLVANKTLRLEMHQAGIRLANWYGAQSISNLYPWAICGMYKGRFKHEAANSFCSALMETPQMPLVEQLKEYRGVNHRYVYPKPIAVTDGS
mmetsp:Transcript_13455/g.19771  ORF Transcript_13455/g.19771 Transcript_13455/m.19771 type:complete len:415 (-) Transcript_13455:129-1373(-)|eukprot:CAMPEP_0113944738 /NCGR_PEP_ID=MMETSP1339-20121228/36294_1 /TAXON_ID=94617 /ORGANISM="Fibrocapsa japonica" /LENGTH=414 /DNA_ID=CAMNT_0000950043 /DNA_START=144 /DNA_END=1388 /DNA_ORIENTATION=+ /assembly_acc=CAM_ASM_000762